MLRLFRPLVKTVLELAEQNDELMKRIQDQDALTLRVIEMLDQQQAEIALLRQAISSNTPVTYDD